MTRHFLVGTLVNDQPEGLLAEGIFRKHGFVERVRRSYEAHRFNGRAVFATIGEHGGPILMDRSLPSD